MFISFPTKIDLSACEFDCHFANDHQITAVDVVMSERHAATLAQIKALRHVLHTYGVRCALFSLVGCNHLVVHAEQRQQMKSLRDRACEYASILDASVFVTTSGMRSTVLDENAYMFAQELRHTIATVQARGMRFAVQMDATGFVDGITAYERIGSLIGQVYCVFDPVALVQNGGDVLAFLHKHANKIAHVRAADVLCRDDVRIASPPVGMGDLRWGPMLSLLYEGGYHGALSITPDGGFWNRNAQRHRMILLSQHHLNQYLFDADNESVLANKVTSLYGRMV